MSEDAWGPWIEHDGKGCPCKGQYVQAIFSFGHPLMDEDYAHEENDLQWDWRWADARGKARIIRYRIRQSRTQAAVEALKVIAANPKRKFREAVET